MCFFFFIIIIIIYFIIIIIINKLIKIKKLLLFYYLLFFILITLWWWLWWQWCGYHHHLFIIIILILFYYYYLFIIIIISFHKLLLSISLYPQLASPSVQCKLNKAKLIFHNRLSKNTYFFFHHILLPSSYYPLYNNLVNLSLGENPLGLAHFSIVIICLSSIFIFVSFPTRRQAITSRLSRFFSAFSL